MDRNERVGGTSSRKAMVKGLGCLEIRKSPHFHIQLTVVLGSLGLVKGYLFVRRFLMEGRQHMSYSLNS